MTARTTLALVPPRRLRLLDYDTLARHRKVIDYATYRAFRSSIPGEFSLDEVRNLAYQVASDRHALWDAGKVPPSRDMEIHLLRLIRDDRYRRGWRQVVKNGKRVWVGDGINYVPFSALSPSKARRLGSRADEPYRVLFGDDDGGTYALAADWPPFTPGQRRQFARFMESRYPGVCDAFEDVDREAKPPREAWDRWQRSRDVARARLRVQYARELAEARFAVTYGLAA